MDVSRRGTPLLLLFVLTVSSQWRDSGGGTFLADALLQLTDYPPYCAKNMDLNAIPSLADSVTQSFGDGVSLGDVELLQVHTQHVESCFFPLPSLSLQACSTTSITLCSL